MHAASVLAASSLLYFITSVASLVYDFPFILLLVFTLNV